MTLTYWILILSVNVLCSQGQKCGGIAEEDAEYTLTCTIASPGQGLLWQLQNGTNYVNISFCDSSGICTDLMPTSFQANRSKTVAQTGTETHMGSLKILHAKRTYNRFKCVRAGDSRQEICNIQVYVKTGVPTCQGPILTKIGTGTYLKVTCTSEKIYPLGNCTFKYKGLPSNISVDVISSHRPSSQSPGNYKIECSWIALISGASPGIVQVQVEAYPFLDRWIEAASTYSDWTRPTVLSFPVVVLASNCPFGLQVRNGYILSGSQATCKCETTSAGYPPGFAQWYTESGEKLGIQESDGSSTLTLDHGRTGSRYMCRPVSILSNPKPQQETFSPQYAAGPTTLTIDMSDSLPLCPSESFTYRITCKVPSENVIPQPLFTVVINNQTKIDNQKGQRDTVLNNYFLTYTFRPESGGAQRIYCKATNEIFSEQFYEFERPLIINEPPRLAPVLKTYDNQPESGSNIAYITDWSDVHLTCRVEGGHPRVSNITIVCGNNWNSMQGTLATITVRIPDGVKTLTCHCLAVHITGCYDKRTDIVLKLGEREPPSKGNSDTNDMSDNLSLGLGIGLGGVAILVIVLVIVFIILHKRREIKCKDNQDMHYNQPDFTSTESYHYASVLPGRPDLPQRPPPSQPDQGDYDLIALDTDVAPKSSANRGVLLRNDSTTDLKHVSYIPDGYIQPI